MTTLIHLSEIKDKPLEDILRQVIRERKPLTILLSESEQVTLQPGEKLEQAYWNQLQEQGLVKVPSYSPGADIDFAPIYAQGNPVSQTIIAERR